MTEDYLVTLKMKAQGFRTVYLNERLSLGLAPEGLKEYVTQRSRWALGFVQICRGDARSVPPQQRPDAPRPRQPDRDLPLLVRQLLVPPARHHRADPVLAVQRSRGAGRRRRHARLLPAVLHLADRDHGLDGEGPRHARDVGRDAAPRGLADRPRRRPWPHQAQRAQVPGDREGRRPQQAVRTVAAAPACSCAFSP